MSEFKKEKLAEEVEKLENKKDELKDQMKTYKNAEEYALVTVRKIKGDEDFVLKISVTFNVCKNIQNQICRATHKKAFGDCEKLCTKMLSGRKG